MNLSVYIAKRYAISFSKNKAINIITGIASVGIIASTMALFVFLSVFSGLKDFSLSFSNDFDPDLKAVAKTGKTIFISPQQENEISKIEGVAHFSKIIEERALFTFNGKDILSNIKGVDKNFNQVNQVEKTISGTFKFAVVNTDPSAEKQEMRFSEGVFYKIPILNKEDENSVLNSDKEDNLKSTISGKASRFFRK